MGTECKKNSESARGTPKKEGTASTFPIHHQTPKHTYVERVFLSRMKRA